MNIPTNYLPAFGKVFSPSVMDSLAKNGNSGYLSEVCYNSKLIEQIDPSMSLKEFLQDLYNSLQKNYRSEYIYKNVIANKILLGKHSLNTSHMLSEFRVGNCKADVVILNGTSTVYEIKSEYDSFSRLENQVHTYLDIFDYVNVITSFNQAEKLKSSLPSGVGLLVLTKKNRINTIREPISNVENINLEKLFGSLRKAEFSKIIKDFYSTIPSVPNTLFYKECKKWFCQIPVKEAHKLTINALRQRSNAETLKKFLEKAPDSLTAYAMTICMKKNSMEQLMDRFDLSINSIIDR